MVLRRPVRGHPVRNVPVIVPTLSSPRYVFQWHSSASNIRHLLHHSQSLEVRCHLHSSDNSVDDIWSPSDKWLSTVPPLSSLRFVSHWKKFQSPDTFSSHVIPNDKLLRHSYDTFFTTLVYQWRMTPSLFRHFLHHSYSASDEFSHHSSDNFFPPNVECS